MIEISGRGLIMLPEIIGMLLFFAATILSTFKISEDFGERGELGYVMLVILIAIYAGAIGLAWSQFEVEPEIGSALTCEKVDNYVVCTERWK